MKKKFLIVISLLFVFTTSYIGWKYFRAASNPSEKTIFVAVSQVEETLLPLELHGLGTLTARSVEVSPELTGHVKAIFFTDGSYVDSNTPLLQLDDSIYRTKYELAKAKLGFSKQNYDRMVLLGKQGAISKQAIDQAEADYKEKAADLDENRVMVKKMRLNAPFAGRLGKSKVNVGDYVTVGQSIVAITDTKILRVEYSVPEKFLPAIKLGQTVVLTSAAYPKQSFTGKVSYISPTVSADNRSIHLYAEIENHNDVLAPGMFVNVIQLIGQNEHALMIPARSLLAVLDGQQVYKVVAGKAYAIPVTIGRRIKEKVQIVNGLNKNDIIVTDGQLKLRNGIPVQITKNHPSAT